MKCSFCDREQEKVTKLIIASDKLAICDECVFSCLEGLVYGDEAPDAIELDDE